jgi:hypothetical protein
MPFKLTGSSGCPRSKRSNQDGSGEKQSLLKTYESERPIEKDDLWADVTGWESYDQAQRSAQGGGLEIVLEQLLVSRLFKNYDPSSRASTVPQNEGWERPLELYNELGRLRKA